MLMNINKLLLFLIMILNVSNVTKNCVGVIDFCVQYNHCIIRCYKFISNSIVAFIFLPVFIKFNIFMFVDVVCGEQGFLMLNIHYLI